MLIDWPELNEAPSLAFCFDFCSLFLTGNKSWANPPESCDDYEGQKAGRYDQSKPYANSGELAIIVFVIPTFICSDQDHGWINTTSTVYSIPTYDTYQLAEVM